jgi:hypothetical protein
MTRHAALRTALRAAQQPAIATAACATIVANARVSAGFISSFRFIRASSTRAFNNFPPHHATAGMRRVVCLPP